MVQINLANILGILGQRENGSGRLKEAVTAYREVLKNSSRDREPLQWAMAQHGLANALVVIGNARMRQRRWKRA
jgi:hypothetical protein